MEMLPAYSYQQPTASTTPEEEPSLERFKFGDALVCEWSDAAYHHIFKNPAYKTFWETNTLWEDPNPPTPVPEKEHIDLDDCLDEFAREEQLGENDEWWCPKCRAHRQAKKTLQLWRVPDVFVLHLKRFSANRSFRDKLDNFIDFPLNDLDLTERVGDKAWIEQERGGEKLLYDLFAVDSHYGGLAGGHYTAYAKNFVDDKWYYFDGLLDFSTKTDVFRWQCATCNGRRRGFFGCLLIILPTKIEDASRWKYGKVDLGLRCKSIYGNRIHIKSKRGSEHSIHLSFAAP